MKTIDAHVHLTSFLFEFNQENPIEGPCVKKCLELMDKHGIDQCIALGGQGVSIYPLENDMLISMAKALPERIAGVMVGFSTPKNKWEFDPDTAAMEIENYLKDPIVKGFGELAIAGIADLSQTWPEVLGKLRPIFDSLAAHHAIANIHTGCFPQFFIPGEGRKRSTGALHYSNPALIDDIATEYPDVPILMAHAGVQGFYFYGNYPDMALTVAARNPNVFIDTSSVPYDVLLKAVECPAIGPEKLVFGSDIPAFYEYYQSPTTKEYYPSYGKTGPGPETPDHYEVDLANIDRLPITSTQKDMIMGGTLARLLAEKK